MKKKKHPAACSGNLRKIPALKKTYSSVLLFIIGLGVAIFFTSCLNPLQKEYTKKTLLTLSADHQFFTGKVANAPASSEEEALKVPNNDLKRNNVAFFDDKFLYENFYDVNNETLALFNRKHRHIAFGKSNDLQIYSAPWIDSVIGVISDEEMMVAITYTFNGTLGLMVLEDINGSMQFKGIYPFYRTEKSLDKISQNIASGRIRHYKDDVFNIKIDYNTVVRVSKERFGRWHKITENELKKIHGDYLYQDIALSNSPENAFLIFQQNNSKRDESLIVAEYSLESQKILSSKTIKINAGVYYSTTENDEIITTRYNPDTASYLFTYYSIKTGKKIKTRSFLTSKETYPRNLVYNGRQLHGFHHEGNSIAISIWK